MAPLSFGTDGVRGLANAELTPELALALGRAVARTLGVQRCYLGRDTRRSSPMLAAALCAGVTTEGASVVDLGVIPTPAVAALCARDGVFGLVVSASHNPFGDNGIKVFAKGGTKLTEELERQIELELAKVAAGECATGRPTGSGVGTITVDAESHAAYVALLRKAADDTPLDGLHVVLDCAHGAASMTAPEVFRQLGATVTTIGAEPDGLNINDAVGSTSPSAVVDAVVRAGADLGIALDGDADRCMVVDAGGTLLDGDGLLALFAVERQREGTLGGGLVVTVMSNLGLHRAMRDAGIGVEEVPVGDRNVTTALERTGWSLGGEQSGHIIFADRATTGDGTLTGILLAQLVARRGALASLADGLLVAVPQLLVNVEVANAGDLADAADVWREVDAARAELGDDGRVVLRASGTQPMVRIMVEAIEHDTAVRITDSLRAAVTASLGGPEAHG